MYFEIRTVNDLVTPLRIGPSRIEPRKTIFAKLSGDVAISWQLRGLRACSRVYVRLFVTKIVLHGS